METTVQNLSHDFEWATFMLALLAAAALGVASTRYSDDVKVDTAALGFHLHNPLNIKTQAPPTRNFTSSKPAVTSTRKVAPSTPTPAKLDKKVLVRAWVKWGIGEIGSIVRDPASYMVKKTFLGNAQVFRTFAMDPRMVSTYVNHPVVQLFTSNQTVMRTLMHNPRILSAVLNSPAMQDPAAISALVKSPLLSRLAQQPGVSAALRDVKLMTEMLSGAGMQEWVLKNPSAFTAFTQVAGLSSETLAGAPAFVRGVNESNRRKL